MPKHPATTQHNYLAKIAALIPTLPRGTTQHITVRHDPWCDALRSKKKFCNCNAELVMDLKYDN